MLSHNKQYLPCKGINVALFLVSLLNSNTSYSVMSSYVYSIKYFHELYCMPDPTCHQCVKNLLECCKRRNYRPRAKKDVVCATDIRELFVKYLGNKDLMVLRDLTIIVLCFAAFLRYDEVSSLRCKDVRLESDHMSLYIQKSKTDQYRDGNSILVAKVSSVSCPVQAVKDYCSAASIDLKSSDYLFKPIFRTRHHTGLIKKNKKLSYTRTKETVVSRLKEVRPGLNFGLHSLRAGGATAAANNNVDDRCWKRHGRWKSDSSKDGYVKDSTQKRLSVSQSLGL